MPNLRKNRGVNQGKPANTAIAIAAKINVLKREWSEDETKRKDGAEVVDETGRQHGLAVFGPIQAGLDHHRIDHRNRGCGQRDAGEPAWHHLPAENEIGRRRAAEKRKEEADQAECGGLLPFLLENLRIELGAGEKGQHDGADPGEEFDPWLVDAERCRSEGSADDQLRQRSDDDFRQRGGDPQPSRKQARDQRQTQPQCYQRPNSGHRQASCAMLNRPKQRAHASAFERSHKTNLEAVGVQSRLLPTPSAR